MSNWKEALLAGCLIEAPLLALLSLGESQLGYRLFMIVTWYHVIPLSVVSVCWLMLFGHNAPSPGSPVIWNSLYLLAVFVIQVAIITPIVHWVIARKSGSK
jgi:hypothetical protein